MQIEDIIQLTQEYGGDWAINHARRLLHMTRTLAQGQPYDEKVVELAAYLHDWGGYARWAEPGVDHVVRSVQVVGPFLEEHGFPAGQRAAVMECIERHHGGPAERRFESRLFTDADALDLLGLLGAARVFAMNPRNLRAGYEAVKMWRDKSIAALSLPQSRGIAERRLAETNAFLATFEEEAYGMF